MSSSEGQNLDLSSSKSQLPKLDVLSKLTSDVFGKRDLGTITPKELDTAVHNASEGLAMRLGGAISPLRVLVGAAALSASDQLSLGQPSPNS